MENKNENATLNKIEISNFKISKNLLNFELNFSINYEYTMTGKSSFIDNFYFTLTNENTNELLEIYNLNSDNSTNTYFIYETINDEYNSEIDYTIQFKNLNMIDGNNKIIKYDDLTLNYEEGGVIYSDEIEAPTINFVSSEEEHFSNDDFIFSIEIMENDFNYEDIKFFEYDNGKIYDYNYELLDITDNIYTFEIYDLNDIDSHNFYINLGYTFISFENIESDLSKPEYLNNSFTLSQNSAYSNSFYFSIEFLNETNYDLSKITLKADVDTNNDGTIDKVQETLNLDLIKRDKEDYVYFYYVHDLLENATYTNFNCYFSDTNDLIFQSSEKITTNSIEEDNFNFRVFNETENSFSFTISENEDISQADLNNAELNAKIGSSYQKNLNINYLYKQDLGNTSYQYFFYVDDLTSGTTYSDFVLTIPNTDIFNQKITSSLYVKTLNKSPQITSFSIFDVFISPRSFRFKLKVKEWGSYEPEDLDIVLRSSDNNTEIDHEIYFQDYDENGYYYEVVINDSDFWGQDVYVDSLTFNDDRTIPLDDASINDVQLTSSKPSYIDGTFKIEDIRKHEATIKFGYYQDGENVNNPYDLYVVSTYNDERIKLDSRLINIESADSQISYYECTYKVKNLQANESYNNLNFYFGGSQFETNTDIQTKGIMSPIIYYLYFIIGIILIIGVMLLIKKIVDYKIKIKYGNEINGF